MSLRTRLWVAGGVLILVIAGAALLVLGTVETSEVRQVDQRVTTAFPVVFRLGRPQRLAVGGTSTEFRPPVQNQAVTDIYTALISNGHRKEVLTPALTSGQAPRVPKTLSRMEHGKPVPETVSSISGSQRWRAVLISVPGSSERLLVAASLAQVDATTSRLKFSLLAAGGLVILVLAAAGFWVERLGLRPLAKVAEAADAIAAGERGRRVAEVAPGTEAGHLVRAFNIMLDDQRATEDRLRQFVADASHELRTPLTAVRGLADLWKEGHLREGAALDDAMRRIGRESFRMAGLVENLLMLARLDSNIPFHRQEVDLSAIARQTVRDAKAGHPNRRLEMCLEDACTVDGDPDALRQIVANLVNNSLVHTPPSSAINIHTKRLNGHLVLTVQDDGPGMESDAATRAFDRFWRADASRGRPGSGLGLSIVSAIVAAHGGNVTMKSARATGTLVAVYLPASSSREPTQGIGGVSRDKARNP